MTHYDPNRPIIDPEHDPRRDPFRDPAIDAETVSAMDARQGPEGRQVTGPASRPPAGHARARDTRPCPER